MQALQLGNDHPTPMQFDEPFVLQLIQDARHVQATVVQFLCQSFHQNEEGLGACRITAVGDQETDQSFLQGLRCTAPQLLREFLGLGGIVVDEIQTKHQEVFQQPQHLLLIDREQTDIRLSRDASGVTLVITEQIRSAVRTTKERATIKKSIGLNLHISRLFCNFAP